MELKWWQHGWFAYWAALTLIGVPATLAWLTRSTLGRGFDGLLLVVLVAVAARVWGTRPGLAAAVVSFFALGAIGSPVFFDLHPDNAGEWVETLVFLFAVIFMAIQVGRLRDSETTAVLGRQEALTLSRLTSALVPETRIEAVAEEVVASLRDLTGAGTVRLLVPDDNGVLTAVGETGRRMSAMSLDEGDIVVYAWENSTAVGLPPPPSGERVAGWPKSVPVEEALPSDRRLNEIALPLVGTDQAREGILFVGRRERNRPYDPAMASRLVLVGRLISVFIERHRLQQEAARAQATTEAERLRANLMSSVSHELKTPLASISATVSGLLEEPDSDCSRVRAELESVDEDVRRLNSSISDLLDLSRLETDEWRSTKDWHDLSDIVGSVVADLRDRDRARIVIDAPEEPVLAFVDFVQLSRAVFHLVENALAYSPSDQRVVVKVDDDGGIARISVADRGPGVPEYERQLVFEKFYRGAASAAVPHGTGLGLSIVSEIVARHDGRLRVESVRPRGARFVLELPGSRDDASVTPVEEDE